MRMLLVASANTAGRRKPAAGAVLDPFAAGEQLGALLGADPQVVEILVELATVDDRADVGALRQRRPHRERVGRGHHPLDERVVDPGGDDQPAGGGAALAGRVEGALDGAVDGDVEVGVVEHDQRVLAAHLELDARAAASGGLGDARPGLDRAGEADGIDAGVLDERVADLAAASTRG